MARGDFSASDLARVELRMNQMFSGERLNQMAKWEYGIVKDALAKQTASFSGLTEGKRDVGAKVVFLKDCDAAVIDCADAITCKIVGKRLESVSVNVDVNACIRDTLSVYDDEWDDNHFKRDEKIAEGFARMFGRMRFELQKVMISHYESTAFDFTAVTPEYGTKGVDTTELEFPAVDWDGSLIGKIKWIADQYGVYTPTAYDGGNFWLPQWENRFKSQGSAYVDALDAQLPIVYGTKTVRALTGVDSTFLVDPDAVAFLTKNYYRNEAPVATGDENNTRVWRMPIPDLTMADGGAQRPVYIDVEAQRQCFTENNHKRWANVFQFQLHYGLINSPDVCNTGETGIIHLVRT